MANDPDMTTPEPTTLREALIAAFLTGGAKEWAEDMAAFAEAALATPPLIGEVVKFLRGPRFES